MEGLLHSGGPCRAAGVLPRPSRSNARTRAPPVRWIPPVAQATTLEIVVASGLLPSLAWAPRGRWESLAPVRAVLRETQRLLTVFTPSTAGAAPPSLPFARLPLGTAGCGCQGGVSPALVRAYEWCSDCNRRLAPCSVHRTVDGQSPSPAVAHNRKLHSMCPFVVALCCLPVRWERSA